jgi:F-box and WD-40 domain protein CDC4
MDDQDNKSGLDNESHTGSIGQFSFAPATRTTVVTTTTTTTTTFPPLFIKPPRATRELDPKLYPLASSPTPSSLRNVRFAIGDHSVVFNEPEDTAGAVNEVRLLIKRSPSQPCFSIPLFANVLHVVERKG